MRMRFNEIFETLPDGRIMPKVHVRLGPMTMTPGSAALPPNSVRLGDLSLSDLLGKDFEVRLENGLHIIEQVYKF